MKELMRLLTLANDDDHFYFVPRVSLKEFIGAVSGGNMFVLTGDLGGLFAITGEKYNHQNIMLVLDKFCSKNVFIELSAIDTILYDTVNGNALKNAKFDVGNVIATYPVMYGDEEDSDSLDVLSAISRNVKVSDKWHYKQYVRDFNLKTPEEYNLKYKEVEEKFGIKVFG